MDLGLNRRRALITGGSRGIGKATAAALAAEGVHCVIVARGKADLEASAAEIREKTGAPVHAVVGNTADAAESARIVGLAVDELGGLDILINCAARASGGEPEDFAHVTDELILSDFEEKYLGYLRMTRAAVPHMRETGWGRVVNVSGLAARRAGSLSAGARNVAVVHLTASLARELGKDGITVNAVYPGITVTERLEARLSEGFSKGGPSPQAALEQMAARTPMGRLVTADEVASVATFLSSELAVGINGEVIAVSGGSGDSVYY